jgi:predicted CxxxxCH...CXXCH cytochrome family protein
MGRSSFRSQGGVALAGCVAFALVLVLGCGESAPKNGAAPKAGRATSAATAATPTACAGAQTCTSTDAHAKHQAAGFDCVACHPCGGKFGFQVGYTFSTGLTTIQATDSYTAASGTTPATCTVACHYPMGSPAAPIQWNAAAPGTDLACVRCHDVPTLLAKFPGHPQNVSPGATRADCEQCHLVSDQHTQGGGVVLQSHPASWMTTTDPGFHAFSADRGLTACQTCHLKDLSGGVTKVACTNCHKAGGQANDFATCTACHGGKDNGTGAPPGAIWGYAGDPARGGGAGDPIRVGAHTAHVTAGQFGPAFGCEVCHVKPTSIFDLNHIDSVDPGNDPMATVTFGGLAVNGVTTPTWSRSNATCNSTYCHGATTDVNGVGGIKNPSWTGGSSQVFCGSCHGVPPALPHIQMDTSKGFGVCSGCHALTVDPTGAIIPASQGGKHLDGLLEASGHDATWMDTTSSNFHAFAADRGIQNCTPCHGADLAGGSVGTACTECHKAGGQANDFATCTACHGNGGTTGAPPEAIWGYAGDPNRGGGTADPIRVGAHTKHLAPTLTTAFDCSVCHVKPTSILSAGHIDDPTPVATVTFGGIATSVPPGTSPSWNRGAAACASTYCHGNYAGVYAYNAWDWGADAPYTVYVNYKGNNGTPNWTGGPMTCGSCHGNPPPGTGTWHSGHHGNSGDGYNECQLCHPDAFSVGGVGQSITNPAQHVNGIVEVTPNWNSKCFGCH